MTTAQATVEAAAAKVLIVGNPNSGKSTLFNALSGGSAHVANYPGVTIDRSTAHLTVGHRDVELIDVPGTYSLSAQSPEEQIAVDSVFSRDEDVAAMRSGVRAPSARTANAAKSC